MKQKIFEGIEKLMILTGLVKKASEEEEKIFFLNVEDEENHKKLAQIKRKKQVYRRLIWIILGAVLLSSIYLYRIGRSFRPSYLKNSIHKVAASPEAKTAAVEGLDKFDKLF